MGEQIVALLQELTAAPDPMALGGTEKSEPGRHGPRRGCAEEAARERANHLTGAPDPRPLVRNLRRLRHDLTMVDRATAEPLSEPVRSRLVKPATRASAPSLDRVAQALDDYAGAMAKVRRQGLTHALSGEAADQIFGLAFALEQLRENLADLADRVSKYSD
jgi:hypothetical protein